MNYLRDIGEGFKSVLDSMTVTLRNLFTHAITLQYPDERRELPLRSMNRHVLTVDLGTGKLKCTACMACVRACPARCIEIVGMGKGKERYPEVFKIDHTLCMYCGLCVESCPFDAITMWTGKYETATYTREDLIFDKISLIAEGFYPTPGIPEPPAVHGP